MKKNTHNKIITEILHIKEDIRELEGKQEKTKQDEDKLKELKGLLFQMENMLRWS